VNQRLSIVQCLRPILAASLACAFVIDASAEVGEDMDRALERALTRESGLVLPRGVYELELGVGYDYRGSDALRLVDLDGLVQVAQQGVKQDRIESHIAVRAGLPAATSAELRLPLVFSRDEIVTGAEQKRTNEFGAGDVELALTKQLAPDRPGRPGALMSLNWRVPTGDFDLAQPSSPGGGFHTVQGATTAVMRQDPLVFFGTLSYTFVAEDRHEGLDIDPGDYVGLKLGSILAVSPRTSIRGAFQVSRSGRTEVDGREVPGSDAVVAALEIGVATLITPRSLLALEIAIGVTPDAPDFSIRGSLPIRYHRGR
jgi:hypothetical protein